MPKKKRNLYKTDEPHHYTVLLQGAGVPSASFGSQTDILRQWLDQLEEGKKSGYDTPIQFFDEDANVVMAFWAVNIRGVVKGTPISPGGPDGRNQ